MGRCAKKSQQAHYLISFYHYYWGVDVCGRKFLFLFIGFILLFYCSQTVYANNKKQARKLISRPFLFVWCTRSSEYSNTVRFTQVLLIFDKQTKNKQ